LFVATDAVVPANKWDFVGKRLSDPSTPIKFHTPISAAESFLEHRHHLRQYSNNNEVGWKS